MSAAPDTPAERLGRLRAALRAATPPPRAENIALAEPGAMREARQLPVGLAAAAPGLPHDRIRPSLSVLADRIARLAAGRAPPASPALRTPVADADARARREPLDDAALASRLGGHVHAPGVIGFTHEHPLPAPHALHATDLQWLGLGEQRPDVSELCFVDTETSGLAGGCGTLPFLIGLARVRGSVLHVRQWLLTGFAGERSMLLALQKQAAESRGWVSYNGKSFDLPLLATRLALARLAPLPAFRPHADLLHAVRVAYGRHWPDCRLATAEARLLGRTRDNDLPGHAVPAAWTAFLREGDLRALPGVLLHNRLDLVSLAELLPVLGTLYDAGAPSPPASGRWPPPAADHAAIARAQLRRGRPASALRQLEAATRPLDDRARLLQADLLRRSGRVADALALWEELASRNVIPAIVALLRHDRRAPGSALRWADRLCTLAPDDPRHRRRVQRIAHARIRSGSLPLPGLDEPGKK